MFIYVTPLLPVSTKQLRSYQAPSSHSATRPSAFTCPNKTTELLSTIERITGNVFSG